MLHNFFIFLNFIFVVQIAEILFHIWRVFLICWEEGRERERVYGKWECIEHERGLLKLQLWFFLKRFQSHWNLLFFTRHPFTTSIYSITFIRWNQMRERSASGLKEQSSALVGLKFEFFLFNFLFLHMTARDSFCLSSKLNETL